MNRSSWRWGVAAVLLALLLPAATAEAVIPSAMGPIQALIVVLPQILLALGAGLVALLKPRTYKFLAAYLWSHKAFTVVLLGIVGFLIWGPSFSGGRAAAEQSGVTWSAFRGGPARTGAVAGSKGFQGAPTVPWKLVGNALGGSTVAVDSSPCVVGNRLYVGVGYNLGSPFGSSGAIVAADADTGAVAWRWTGKGELPSPLHCIFSSPAVWAEPPAKGEPPAARWLVCGEGYHEDTEGRLICLDLEPVRKSGGKEPPKLAWFLQATDHAEASPLLHEGKVITGCGIDGVWCVELATGKILWHLTGEPDSYELKEGPKTAALASLAGKTVALSGTVARVGAGAKDKNDPGTMTIDVKDFREAAQAPVPLMDSARTLERTVFGKIVKDEKVVRLVPPYSNPDSESSPVAVTLPSKEQRVIFGSGIHGQRVVCVNAETGAVIWKTPTEYPAFGAPAVAGDRVLAGIGKGDFVEGAADPAGMVVCLSLADGKELWKTKTGDTILGSIAVQEGRAYACSKDGNLYIFDIASGQIVQKLPAGAPMVGSPAVTADAVYVGTMTGRLVAFDRKTNALRTSFPLAPGTEIISSPAIANGKLFVGTRAKGIFAVADLPADGAATAARPWLGPGGDAGRSGCADDRRLPALQPVGDQLQVPARWPTPPALARPVSGPVGACGPHVTAALENSLVQIDESTGKILWEVPGKFLKLRLEPDVVYAFLEKADWLAFEPATGKKLDRTPAPAELVVHHLSFSIEGGGLACHGERKDVLLWKSLLKPMPAQPPSVSGAMVFVALQGEGAAKGFVEAHRLVDGAPVWRQELDGAPLSPPVVSGDWLAIATDDDKVALFHASDGKKVEPVPIGGKPVAPAISNDLLIVAGGERIAGYDLSSLSYVWNYVDQDNIGTATSQPVVSRETIWVGTSKKGLVAIGVPKK